MIPNSWRGFDFALGEDVEALRETVARFSAAEIAPQADAIDRSNTFPRALWPKLGAQRDRARRFAKKGCQALRERYQFGQGLFALRQGI